MSLASATRQLDPVARRLRVGYMSSDFGGHTVGSLIRNLLKMHNRNRVEIVGIGVRPIDLLGCVLASGQCCPGVGFDAG